jgi:hypothetical protein
VAEKTVRRDELPSVMKMGRDLSPVFEIELTTRIASPVVLADTKRVFAVPVLLRTIPFRTFAEEVEFEKLVSRIWPVPEFTCEPPSHSWPGTPAVETAVLDEIEISPPPEKILRSC